MPVTGGIVSFGALPPIVKGAAPGALTEPALPNNDTEDKGFGEPKTDASGGIIFGEEVDVLEAAPHCDG